EAIRLAEDLVGICRTLATTEPVVKIALPGSLAILATNLRKVRRYEDGLCIEAEVVKLLRERVETDLSSSAELIRSLARLSLDLTAVGRHDEALRVGEERVELCRRAAATCYTPSDDLASSLHLPGSLLHELGRKEDTLLPCEEAVKLRRNLQETDTVPVLSLANSLENMGVLLRALGRHKESASMAQEAVDLQRRLIATDTDLTGLVHSPKSLIIGSFAHSLENMAFSQSTVGNAEDVVRAAGESVDIYCSVPDRTAGLEAGLVNALSPLAAFLHAVNRQEDASRDDKEGAEIYRNSVKTDAELTTRSFRASARDLRSVGLREDALRAEGKSTHLYRTVTQTRPALPGLRCGGYCVALGAQRMRRAQISSWLTCRTCAV
ncbi:hypothetical protein B0H13DRAFT_1643332, partial [Mycena leptocephala]